MYESFYGFSERPFQLNPDPQFYFASRQHRRAMAFVEYGLHQSEGFIVVTGEVGAGKTTVVRSLLAKLDAQKVVAANLVSTQLDADDMLRMVAAAFGVPTKGLNKSDLLLALEAMLASQARDGKRCLLIVDEAQNLSARAVEELRMLSNFQLGTHALLQSFLVGQPEFRLILQSPQLYQLRQRVIAACHIGPLDAEDTRSYIEHRMRHVGWKDDPVITKEAFSAIVEATGGVPRRINLLCDRMLLSGFLAEKRLFSEGSVREIAAEINSETLAPESLMRTDPEHFSNLPTESAQIAAAGHLGGSFDRALAEGARRAPEFREPVSLGPHLFQVEQEMRDLKETLIRVERGNHATLGLFRRFLDWVRTRDTDRIDRP